MTPVEVLNQLTFELADEPLHFTGLTPLLKNAQQEIFDGFWQSFTAACLTISIVMILSLRSIVAGVIAMIPNIIPIWLVFGGVGFLGMPVDIGMMMTGSIALGISVDCTFHFLVKYQTAYKNGATSTEAVLQSLEHSGEPMLDSTLISALGMLASVSAASHQRLGLDVSWPLRCLHHFLVSLYFSQRCFAVAPVIDLAGPMTNRKSKMPQMILKRSIRCPTKLAPRSIRSLRKSPPFPAEFERLGRLFPFPCVVAIQSRCSCTHKRSSHFIA